MCGPNNSRLIETLSRYLGRTNKNGRFVIKSKEIDPAKESVLVEKHGFLPSVVEKPLFGNEYHLVLKQGCVLSLKFKDPFNRPLKGIHAWASRLVWQEDFESAEKQAGPYEGKAEPETIIHHGVSKEDGTCSLEGLPPGPVTLRVYSMEYATVDISPTPPLTLPCGEITITMAPLYAVAVKVIHDKLEYASMTLTSEDLFGGGTPWSQHQCMFWADHLRKKGGADYAVVSPILKGWNGEAPETLGKAPVHLLLAKRGWIQENLTIRRFGPSFKPEILDSLKFPVDKGMGSLRISLVNPDGTPLPFEKIQRKSKPLFWLEPIHETKGNRLPRGLGCYPEETKSLPSGRYRATLPGYWFHLFLREKNPILEVKPGRLNQKIFKLKEYLVPFRLDIKDRDGGQIKFAFVTIEASGFSGPFVCRGFLPSAVFFGPVGPNRILIEPPDIFRKIVIQHTFGIPDKPKVETLHALAVRK